MRDVPTFEELYPETVKVWMKAHRLSARKLAAALGISSRTFRNHLKLAGRPLPRRTALAIISIAMAGGFLPLVGANFIGLDAARNLARALDLALLKKRTGEWQIKDAHAIAAARRIAAALAKCSESTAKAENFAS